MYTYNGSYPKRQIRRNAETQSYGSKGKDRRAAEVTAMSLYQ